RPTNALCLAAIDHPENFWAFHSIHSGDKGRHIWDATLYNQLNDLGYRRYSISSGWVLVDRLKSAQSAICRIGKGITGVHMRQANPVSISSYQGLTVDG